MGMNRSNQACGPIMVVKSSTDVSREPLQGESCKMPPISPHKTQKWGSMHVQWEYAWLSVCSTTMRDRATVSKDHLWETTYQESNGLVTDHTSRDPKRSSTWPQNLWSSISQQPCEIHAWSVHTDYQQEIAHSSPIVTWSMTSCDLERSRSYPENVWSLISQKTCEIDGRFKYLILIN